MPSLGLEKQFLERGIPPQWMFYPAARLSRAGTFPDAGISLPEASPLGAPRFK